MQKILTLLLHFSGCNAVEYWIKREDKIVRCSGDSDLNHVGCKLFSPTVGEPPFLLRTRFQDICWKVFQRQKSEIKLALTKKGSLVVNNIETCADPLIIGEESYLSFAAIPMTRNSGNIGILILKSHYSDFFSPNEIKMYERFNKTLGFALMNHQVQAAQKERVKELTCFYAIAKLSEKPELSIDDTLMKIVKILPPAWQYPEITSARFIFNGRSYALSDFQESDYSQTADIVIKGEKQGVVEVVYLEEKPHLDEGLFLKGERALINTMATQVAQLIERKQAQGEQAKLQKQLRHADRLATIGQLAAGIAHELNEPLGNILGFAQLVKKNPQLSDQAVRDTDKIVRSALQARDVIKKLLLFARQTPHTMKEININDVVREGLSFLEERFLKAGIRLERTLDPHIPLILGDPALLQQVLVNLVVNALQAMPAGGNVSIMTRSFESHVYLTVTDTGIGMDKKTLKQIFVPFFTTKDVREGTGLGLAVVHGIVTSHKGRITAESTKGQGTRFEITFPRISLSDQNGLRHESRGDEVYNSHSR